MMDLMGLYRIADENNIAVDCFELKKREALSVMDNDGTCYIAIDPLANLVWISKKYNT